jgi:hypothetical protein
LSGTNWCKNTDSLHKLRVFARSIGQNRSRLLQPKHCFVPTFWT